MRTLWITGATGFTGPYLMEAALGKSWRVVALVRNAAKVRLADGRLEVQELDFDDEKAMSQQLLSLVERQGVPDFLLYNAGLTKARAPRQYYAVNVELSRRFFRCMQQAGIKPGRILYTSSLAAMGPGEPSGDPVDEQQQPRPVTAYGRSKLAAEKSLHALCKDIIIIRPTAIYGPYDRDVLLLLKWLAKGWSIDTGQRQYLSFVHAGDFAQAALHLLEKGEAGEVYHLSDGRGYERREFYALASDLLGVPLRHITVGTVLLKVAAQVSEWCSYISGRPTIFNRDKVNELLAPNWVASIKKITASGFQPAIGLEEGLRQTIKWYKEHGWIKA